jgi:hypothetical protein
MASFRKVTALLCAIPLAAVAIWQGCAVYDSSLLVSPEAGLPESGSDTSVPDGGDGCNHVRWPARPSADDDAAVQNIEFYNALEILNFGTSDGGNPAAEGFDLDNTCTCPGPDSCIPFQDAGTQCDYEGGVDNALGALVKEFSGATNFFDEDYINQGIQGGVFGALFRVRNYNGQANDTNVELSIFVSNGTVGADTDAGPTIPKFDGTDVWTLDPTSLLGGTIGDAGPSPIVAYDLNAYVSDYTLVGNISDMPLAIGAATGEGLVTMDLSGALVIAKLAPMGNTFRATGFVAGRWETKKLLTAMQVLHDPFDFDASLCGDDAIYQLLKGRICALEDISGNVLDDPTRTAPCDALSLGFGFTSTAATYGNVFAKPDSGGGCGPQYTDQCGP